MEESTKTRRDYETRWSNLPKLEKWIPKRSKKRLEKKAMKKNYIPHTLITNQ